jgi:predicted nucleic acid-binding protein
MTGERALSFVDTNVLVYAFDNTSSPKKRVAERLMNALMVEDRLRVSTQVLQELFVTLIRPNIHSGMHWWLSRRRGPVRQCSTPKI